MDRGTSSALLPSSRCTPPHDRCKRTRRPGTAECARCLLLTHSRLTHTTGRVCRSSPATAARGSPRSALGAPAAAALLRAAARRRRRAGTRTAPRAPAASSARTPAAASPRADSATSQPRAAAYVVRVHEESVTQRVVLRHGVVQRVHHVAAPVEGQLVAQSLERHAVALRRALGDQRPPRHALLHLVAVLRLTRRGRAHAALRTHVRLAAHEPVPAAPRAHPPHRLRQRVQRVRRRLHARAVAARAGDRPLRVGVAAQRTLHRPRPGYASPRATSRTEGLLVRRQHCGQLLHEGEVLVLRVLPRLRRRRQRAPPHLEEGGGRVHGEARGRRYNSRLRYASPLGAVLTIAARDHRVVRGRCGEQRLVEERARLLVVYANRHGRAEVGDLRVMQQSQHLRCCGRTGRWRRASSPPHSRR